MGLLDSLSALISSWYDEVQTPSNPVETPPPPPPPPSVNSMETPAPRVSSNDDKMSAKKLAQKLKGYFDLGKEEINKAISCEEWGLPDDAVAHYLNAQRIFAEAMSHQVTLNSSSGSEEIKNYRGKILKWQGKVSERLQTLSRRSGYHLSIFGSLLVCSGSLPIGAHMLTWWLGILWRVNPLCNFFLPMLLGLGSFLETVIFLLWTVMLCFDPSWSHVWPIYLCGILFQTYLNYLPGPTYQAFHPICWASSVKIMRVISTVF